MIIFSKVLGDKGTVYDALRAKEIAASSARDDLIRFSQDFRPIVVWNLTRACNLKCAHCYLDALSPAEDELSLTECKKIVDDLAEVGAPMIIFTGGEPLSSPNLFDVAEYAKEKGLRSVISTNGTMITPEKARRLKEVGIRYVGVSIDAADPKIHDEFRGVEGSWKRALEGARNAKAAGIRTGFRITITKRNFREIPPLLDRALKEGVDRFCVYHLVPTGRGSTIVDEDLSKEEREWVLSFLYEKAFELRDKEIEILTTDSPMDGVYILERLRKEKPEMYEDARKLLALGSGCTMGTKIANIDYRGDLIPCHFVPEIVVGNLRERSFQDIWKENPCAELCEIREFKNNLKGKCGSCDYIDVCRGCRRRAWFATGDWREEDPICIYEPPDAAMQSK